MTPLDDALNVCEDSNQLMCWFKRYHPNQYLRTEGRTGGLTDGVQTYSPPTGFLWGTKKGNNSDRNSCRVINLGDILSHWEKHAYWNFKALSLIVLKLRPKNASVMDSILPILHALTKNELFREYSNVYKLAWQTEKETYLGPSVKTCSCFFSLYEQLILSFSIFCPLRSIV